MILKADNIYKSYTTKNSERTEVLRGLSIEIQRGEFISIQGASGSGKSTLLHCLGGLDKPDAGNIVINFNGEMLNLYNLKDEYISKVRNTFFGFVFQFHHLLPEFTARENVAMPALIAGKSKKESFERTDYLLKRTGIANKSDNKPQNMSGGEQQRVAIARALINSPEIIIADEPTGNLDSDNSAQVLDLIDELIHEFKTTFIIATHSQDIAQRAGKKVFIKNGVLLNQ
jgi:lipoprotein-releasing system ATP-binding protein